MSPRVIDISKEMKMYAELMRRMSMRKCSKCKKIRRMCDFYARRESWCRPCKIAYVIRYQKLNKEGTKRNKTNYVKRSPERNLLAKIKYRERNRKALREKNRKYQRSNMKAVLARCRMYQASKANATPKWLTQAMIKQIRRIYENCPSGSHVDHIVPLRGKIVSGLHVPWNLQYLKSSDNLKKSNKY